MIFFHKLYRQAVEDGAGNPGLGLRRIDVPDLTVEGHERVQEVGPQFFCTFFFLLTSFAISGLIGGCQNLNTVAKPAGQMVYQFDDNVFTIGGRTQGGALKFWRVVGGVVAGDTVIKIRY
jgi:hypothetical protein